MPNIRNGNKEGFEPGLTLLRVRNATTELPRYTTRHYLYTGDTGVMAGVAIICAGSVVSCHVCMHGLDTGPLRHTQMP